MMPTSCIKATIVYSLKLQHDDSARNHGVQDRGVTISPVLILHTCISGTSETEISPWVLVLMLVSQLGRDPSSLACKDGGVVRSKGSWMRSCAWASSKWPKGLDPEYKNERFSFVGDLCSCTRQGDSFRVLLLLQMCF